MRIGVFGVGAVGGYFGGRLAEAGNDVWFVARGPNLAALNTVGLRITSPGGVVTLPVQSTDDPGDVGPVDLVLVAVKTWQLASAMDGIRQLVGPETAVVPLLNGVEAADQLAAALGQGPVLKGMCRIIARLAEPAHVVHVGAEPTIVFGEWDNQQTDRALSIRETLSAAGIEARIPADIDAAIWQKLAFVASVGGVGAMTRAPIGLTRADPSTRSMIEAAVAEVAAVASALGVSMAADVVASSMAFIDGLPEDGSASLQRDLAAGRPSELEAWTGAIVRLGAEVGVPVPTHEAIYGSLVLLEKRARGERSFATPGEAVTPDEFRSRYLADAAERFAGLRDLAERALGQTTDEDFFERLDDDANSIAVLVKHLGGNHRSRWRDFLTTDGEKVDRRRDTEFDTAGETRRSIMARWDEGWAILSDALVSLDPSDLDTVVRIRGVPHSVESAVSRSLAHAALHVGQLVYLAKHFAGPRWRTLSIPRGGTEAYNRLMRERFRQPT